MNQKILNEVLKKLRFDPKTDLLYKLLADVVNPGYYLNRSVQLLREAEYSNKDEKVDEAMKLLVIWQCVKADKKAPAKIKRLRCKDCGKTMKYDGSTWRCANGHIRREQ